MPKSHIFNIYNVIRGNKISEFTVQSKFYNASDRPLVRRAKQKNSFLISQKKTLYYNEGNILNDKVLIAIISAIRLMNTFSTIRILHAQVKPYIVYNLLFFDRNSVA